METMLKSPMVDLLSVSLFISCSAREFQSRRPAVRKTLSAPRASGRAAARCRLRCRGARSTSSSGASSSAWLHQQRRPEGKFWQRLAKVCHFNFVIEVSSQEQTPSALASFAGCSAGRRGLRAADGSVPPVRVPRRLLRAAGCTVVEVFSDVGGVSPLPIARYWYFRLLSFSLYTDV